MRRLTRSVLRAGFRLIDSWVHLMTIRGQDGVIIGNLGPVWEFVVCAPVAPVAPQSRLCPAEGMPAADDDDPLLVGPPPGHPERLCPQIPLSPTERQLEQHFRPA